MFYVCSNYIPCVSKVTKTQELCQGFECAAKPVISTYEVPPGGIKMSTPFEGLNSLKQLQKHPLSIDHYSLSLAQIGASREFQNIPGVQRTGVLNGGCHDERVLVENLSLPSTPTPKHSSRSSWHFPALIYFLLILFHGIPNYAAARKGSKGISIQKRPGHFFVDKMFCTGISGSYLLLVLRHFQNNLARSSSSTSPLAWLFLQWPQVSQLSGRPIHNRPSYLVNVSLLTEDCSLLMTRKELLPPVAEVDTFALYNCCV